MSARTRLVSFAVLGLCVAAVSPAGAHRVDEYLQATRIGVKSTGSIWRSTSRPA